MDGQRKSAGTSIPQDIQQHEIPESETSKNTSATNPDLKHLESCIRAISAPLNSMVGHMALIDSRKFPPDQQERWLTVRNHSDALLRQVANMAEYVDFTLRSRPPPDDMVFDAIEMGAHSAARFFHMAEARKIQVHVRCKQFPIIVRNDQKKISQLLDHFLENAIQFTHAGQVIIQIASNAISPEKNLLKITVKDSGSGITPGLHGEIFSPFMTTQESSGHAGLGLAISQNLCKELNAHLWISSIPGEGSLFGVEIPCEPYVPGEDISESYQNAFSGCSAIFLSPSLEYHNHIIPHLEHWGLDICAYLHPSQISTQHISAADCVIIFQSDASWDASDENMIVARSPWTIECHGSNPATITRAGRSILVNSHSLGSLFKALQQVTASAQGRNEILAATNPPALLPGHILEAFQISSHSSAQHIRQSMESGDMAGVMHELHNLAGSLAAAGAHDLSRYCIELEITAKAEGISAITQKIEELLQIMSARFEALTNRADDSQER